MSWSYTCELTGNQLMSSTKRAEAIMLTVPRRYCAGMEWRQRSPWTMDSNARAKPFPPIA
eukprot:6187570-Pleurochrysis_carterae.AAC.3